MTFLGDLESAAAGTRRPIDELLANAGFNEAGLLPAIAQDANSGAVLMLAWMDREAITRTLRDQQAWYYSRSRQRYWRKGESSGHVQQVVELRFDCDADAILLRVVQSGAACHTLRAHCFYLAVDGAEVVVTEDAPSA